MEKLKQYYYDGIPLYHAGLPGFPRNFTRDSIISSIFVNDMEMLKNQLTFCSLKQGTRNDSFNGEEPGKIFHEYPAVGVKGFSTEFNACDTTALYLIGHNIYQDITGDKSLAGLQKRNIENAKNYILNHLNDYFFIEDPKFCGAERFALNVTYWKDSDINGRESGEPAYPIIYPLAHIQNMCGIRCAAKLLNSKNLENIAENMSQRLKKLIDPNTGTFYIAKDKKGIIPGISSDMLHSLFYLNKKDISKEQINKIIKYSKELETPIGYRTLSPKIRFKTKSEYHVKTIWPFEQAIIHMGARKFGLRKIKNQSSKIMDVLDTDPEIFIINGKEIKKGGCDPQLWTIAAKKYFKNPDFKIPLFEL